MSRSFHKTKRSRSADRQRLSLAVILLALAIASCVTSEPLLAQQDPSSAQSPTQQPQNRPPALSEDLIPPGAIWRFGNYGNEKTHSGFYGLKYSGDGKLLAARDRENRVQIYDTATQRLISEVRGHERWINAIDFSPDGKFILTSAVGTRDDHSPERLKVWNIENGKLKLDLDFPAHSAYFSNDGSRIFALGEAHVYAIQWPSGEVLSRKKWKMARETEMAMSEDGQLVAFYRSISSRPQLFVRDVSNSSTVVLNGPAKIPKRVVFSKNKLWLAACYTKDEKIRLWDLREPRQKNYILTGHKLTAYSLAFSPDNRLLASTSGDDSAIVWDILTREKVAHKKAHEDNVNSAAFSPLDYKLATGASGKKDNSTIVWDIKEELFPKPEPTLPAAIDQKVFDEIWSSLGSSQPKESFQNARKLALGGASFMEMIDNKIGIATQTISSEEIEKWISMLDSPKYAQRVLATETLKKMRGHAEASLRQTLEQTISAEVRYRVTSILKQPVKRPKINFKELRRLHRCIFSLEMIASNEALDVDGVDRESVKRRAQLVLKAIAEGHANIDVSRDAADAIDRIGKR